MSPAVFRYRATSQQAFALSHLPVEEVYALLRRDLRRPRRFRALRFSRHSSSNFFASSAECG
jgi:hypothetical protein